MAIGAGAAGRVGVPGGFALREYLPPSRQQKQHAIRMAKTATPPTELPTMSPAEAPESCSFEALGPFMREEGSFVGDGAVRDIEDDALSKTAAKSA